MWLELAALSGLLMGVRRIYEKELSATFSNFSLAFLLQAFSILPAAFLLFFFPIPENAGALSARFWGPLLIIWLILYPIQGYFFFRSIREGELSDVMPLTAILPLANIGTSFLILGELPTALGVAGIAAVCVGIYLVLMKPGPMQIVRINKPALFMGITMASIALGSTLDKVAIQESAPVFYAVVNLIGATFVYILLAFAFREHGEIRLARSKLPLLVILGILSAITFVSAMAAFALGPTSYTLAVRTLGFLVPVAWGFLFLQESISTRKIAALILVTTGILLLAL